MHWLSTDGSEQETECEGSQGDHADEGLTSPGVLVVLRSMVDGVDFKGGLRSSSELYFPFFTPDRCVADDIRKPVVERTCG